MTRILIIEDDEAIRENILELMEAEGYSAEGAPDGKAGVISALRSPPDVIICDIRMPELDGFGVLQTLRNKAETAAVPFIFLTARAERSDMRSGMSMGADDYLTKPFTRTELLEAIQARLRRQQLNARAPRDSAKPNIAIPKGRQLEVVIESPEMRSLYREAALAASSTLSVLILGETGVGKEVLAHELHRRSPRAAGPFLPVNCAALSESLLESELFGHVKGAFTGASSEQAGIFEAADGGTIFLDEIGEMAPGTQAKLLRVLEDRCVSRVGSRKVKQIDVRIVTATNRDLSEDMASGQFRQDLFYRINGVTLEIPPLRERSAEIEALASQFLKMAASDLNLKSPPRLSQAALQALQGYSWPGNVRELRNSIGRAIVMCRGEEILPEHLPALITQARAPLSAATPMDRLKLEMVEMEKQRIVAALEECGGNQTKAAALLSISRRTLVSRLDTYGLPRPRKGHD